MDLRRFCFLLSVWPGLVYGQPKTTVYPDTLKTAARTIGIRFNFMAAPEIFPKFDSDTIDCGSDGFPGKTVTVYLAGDSIQVANRNFPFDEAHLFPLQLAGRKYTLRLRYNGVFHYFPDEYVREHRGRTFVEIPETFELANILLMLSPAGQKAGNMLKSGRYHDEVIAYFKPFMDHPVFKALDFPGARYMHNYYEFRENSICYNFEGDELVPSEYFFVYGEDRSDYSNAFRNNLDLIRDFAKQSNFRGFYQKHASFYQQQTDKQRDWTNQAGMKQWLEKQFPKRKFDTSKIVFSPIIVASHSAQQFYGFHNTFHFSEMVMFVSGPDVYDQDAGLTEQQRRGLIAGIVFTEMDHNYVNPTTSDYGTAIDSIFSKRDFWTAKNQSGFYQLPESLFNEYMTHALFSLYVHDVFDPATADFLIARREKMMIDHRGFSKFREFNAALMKMKKENADTSVSALYPKIIDWCRSFANR